MESYHRGGVEGGGRGGSRMGEKVQGIRSINWPWLMWLSGLSAGLRIKDSPIGFPVRAHAWVASQVQQRASERQPYIDHFCDHPDYQCFELCILQIGYLFIAQFYFWSFDLFFHLGHISLSWHICYVVRGRALGICQGGATHVAVILLIV